jgi:hypothetical protein
VAAVVVVQKKKAIFLCARPRRRRAHLMLSRSTVGVAHEVNLSVAAAAAAAAFCVLCFLLRLASDSVTRAPAAL